MFRSMPTTLGVLKKNFYEQETLMNLPLCDLQCAIDDYNEYLERILDRNCGKKDAMKLKEIKIILRLLNKEYDHRLNCY